MKEIDAHLAYAEKRLKRDQPERADTVDRTHKAILDVFRDATRARELELGLMTVRSWSV
jgi:hypothetical protein